MFELRDYQKEIANKACGLLKNRGIAYLAMAVRTGKTFTALHAADLYGAKKVLFLTKKKAVESGTIRKDYEELKPSFEITIINNESLHKVTDNDFDLLISDEHHRCGSFPKPNNITKEIKRRFGNLPMIFLSGTPAIESISQWYHQFYVSNRTPFKYSSFYNWHKSKGLVQVKLNRCGFFVSDYSNTDDSIDKLKREMLKSISKEDEMYEEKKREILGQNVTMLLNAKKAEERILAEIEPYLLKYTQKEAGFSAEITESALYYKMPETVRDMTKKLLKDEIIRGRTENVIAENAASMLNKIHQLENGTVITDAGNAYITDSEKALFVRRYFMGRKIAIFYYFQKELDLIKQVFGDDITTDLQEFETTDKSFVIQQSSGSEAISLKAAEALVYFNWGYSGRCYAQGRDRLTTKEREHNNVYFLMAKDSLNEKIYRAIKNKKRYNEKLFIKDYKYGSGK